METELVAMASAALAVDSGLLANPQHKKWLLKTEGAPVSEGAAKQTSLVSAVGMHAGDDAAEGTSLAGGMENSLMVVLSPQSQ